MGIRVTGICAGVLVAVFVTASASATFTTYGGEVKMHDWHGFLKKNANFHGSGVWTLKSPAISAPVKYVEKPLTMSAGSLGKMAKAALKVGAGPIGVITSAVQLADWLIDDQLGTATGEPYGVYRESGTGWCVNSAGSRWDQIEGQCFPSQDAAGQAGVDADPATIDYEILSPGTIRMLASAGSLGSISGETGELQVLASDEEVADALADDYVDSDVAEAMSKLATKPTLLDRDDQVTDGNPLMDAWQEAIDQAQDLTDFLQGAEEQADTNDDGQINENDVPVPEPDIDQLPDQDPTEGQLDVEIPTGCDLLPAVCEIRDWLFSEHEPPDPPEPEWQVDMIKPEDLPEHNNPLPAGECPEDTFSVFGTEYDVPWQPMCDFATGVRPLVLAAAWLTAIFIVVRVGHL